MKERRSSDIKGAVALTTSTAKTIPQNINLIGRLTKNNKCASRTVRTSQNFSNECLSQV